MALREEGSDEDAVQPDNEVGATAPTEAIQVDEHDDVGESAGAEIEAVDAAGSADEAERQDEAALRTEAPADGSGALPEAGTGGADDAAETTRNDESPATVPEAVTEALPAAKPLAAAEPTAAAEPIAAAQPIAAAETIAPVRDSAATVADAFPGRARRMSWKIATAAAAAAAVVIVLVIVAATSGTTPSHKASHHASLAKKAVALSVASVSPANGSTGVNGASPITVTYSGPIATSTPMPTLSPSIAGSWRVSKDKAIFTPQVGFTQGTHVTVNIPPPAATATTAATSFSFTTGHYSVLRLEQLLSQLGYIPVAWKPTDASGDIPATNASAQLAAAYDPPSGTFTFNSGYPAALTSQWSVGTRNEIIDGAVRTFEYDHGLIMNGDAGRKVWSHLLTAIAKGERNQHGYTYVWVTQRGAEHLVLYHNGRVAIRSLVNTGIAGRSTADGTFPVYLRYTVTQMTGTNPNGTPYNDTVYWASYFNGGDAVHAFPRAGYGYYQSLGCVELPSYGSVAQRVWNLITYGTLVTVTGPVA